MSFAVKRNNITEKDARKFIDSLSCFIEEAPMDTPEGRTMTADWITEQTKNVSEDQLRVMLTETLLEIRQLKDERLMHTASLYF